MKSSELHIRQLGAADAAPWRALRLRGLQEHPTAFTSSYEEDVLQPLAAAEKRLAGAPDHRYWGAWMGAELAGIVGLERERRRKNRHKATLVGLYVGAQWQGQGIAAALLRTVVQAAREDGIGLVVLTVTRDNAQAARLYEHAGFCSFGVEPGAIQVGPQRYDKEHMALQLEATS